jgi:hypothetical protein
VHVVDSAGALVLGDAQARFLRRAVSGQGRPGAPLPAQR